LGSRQKTMTSCQPHPNIEMDQTGGCSEYFI
jgi:hypothetical protein